MEYDIAEFLINNKEDINTFLNAELHPTYLASRIFDGHPDLQDDYINEKRLQILIRYLLEQFPTYNYEELASEITTQCVIIYLSN